MNWYAIYTKPRNEKKVVANIQSLGIEDYCPNISVVKQWSDRKKTIIQPLLSSYVFVKLDEKDRSLVFQVPGVVRYLFWLGKPAIVREQEIQAMKELQEEKYKKVCVTGMARGEKMTITEGLFKGQTATLIEEKNNKTILVLDSLGTTLILEK